MFAGHTGVVVKLTEAVMACPTSQDTLFQLLLTAFHAESKPKVCGPLFLAMTAYEVFKEEKEKDESKVSSHMLVPIFVIGLGVRMYVHQRRIVQRSLMKLACQGTLN